MIQSFCKFLSVFCINQLVETVLDAEALPKSEFTLDSHNIAQLETAKNVEHKPLYFIQFK